MKRITVFAMMAFALSLVGVFPATCLAKKGGIGHGGGYSDDGLLYHSHSDRSYSGKGMDKGKALGHIKEKKMKTNKDKGHGRGVERGM